MPQSSHFALAVQVAPPEACRSTTAFRWSSFSRRSSSFRSSIESSARAIETSALNERHDLMQLAGIEEGAVPAADVDHRARQLPEVHAVHHLSAPQARAVLHRSPWSFPWSVWTGAGARPLATPAGRRAARRRPRPPRRHRSWRTRGAASSRRQSAGARSGRPDTLPPRRLSGPGLSPRHICGNRPPRRSRA